MRFSLNKATDLQKRVIAGVAGGAFFIGSLLWSEWSYFVLFFLLLLIGMLEFFRLLNSVGLRPNKFWGLAAGVSLYFLEFFHQKGLVPASYFYLLSLLVTASFIHELYRKKEQPFVNIALTWLGVIYIAWPMSLLHELAFKLGPYQYQPVLGLFLLIWASDTGAYFVGRTFGKHKLFLRISPGKTWEGFFGGVLTTVLVAFVLSRAFPVLDYAHWLMTGAVTGIVAPIGDLVESLLKRSLSVKDSGHFLPGHGGVLDRFDSLLLVVPVVVTLLKFF